MVDRIQNDSYKNLIIIRGASHSGKTNGALETAVEIACGKEHPFNHKTITVYNDEESASEISTRLMKQMEKYPLHIIDGEVLEQTYKISSRLGGPFWADYEPLDGIVVIDCLGNSVNPEWLERVKKMLADNAELCIIFTMRERISKY